MKKFFNQLEERFVFPIGRRSWNIIVLLSLLALAGGLLFLLINLLPTGRGSVDVSKNEVIENRVDTSAVAVKTDVSCSQAEYNTWLDTLKADLPKSEWVNLGDSSEPYEAYLVDEYGNYVLDEFSNYVRVIKRDFQPNNLAIPNQLQNLFNNHGLDSADFCQKIGLIKTLHAFNKITKSDYLTEQGVYAYFYILAQNRNITQETVSRSNSFFSAIENTVPLIKNETDANQYNQYLEFILRSNTINDEQISLVKALLNAHRELPNAKYKKTGYFSIAETVLESDLPAEELDRCVNGFMEDIGFYDAKDLKGSLKRYIKIYGEKLERELELQAMKEMEKKNNRYISMMVIGISFAAAILIAIILLLFSIQSLLKNHVEK